MKKLFKKNNQSLTNTLQSKFLEILTAMNYGPGDNYETSGEKQAIEYIKKNLDAKAPIIFDVGANVGGYTLMLT